MSSEKTDGVSVPTQDLEQLLRGAKSGSAEALGELLQSYRDYLALIAEAELGSDLKAKVGASDLVQESCLEVHRDFASFPGETLEDFRLWLRRVFLNNLANVARSFRATSKRDISKEVRFRHPSFFFHDAPGPDKTAILNERLDAVRSAMSELPEHFQQVIYLHNYQRLPFEEIALQMNRSLDAVRKLWARAVESLQQKLEKENGSS